MARRRCNSESITTDRAAKCLNFSFDFGATPRQTPRLVPAGKPARESAGRAAAPRRRPPRAPAPIRLQSVEHSAVADRLDSSRVASSAVSRALPHSRHPVASDFARAEAVKLRSSAT